VRAHDVERAARVVGPGDESVLVDLHLERARSAVGRGARELARRVQLRAEDQRQHDADQEHEDQADEEDRAEAADADQHLRPALGPAHAAARLAPAARAGGALLAHRWPWLDSW